MPTIKDVAKLAGVSHGTVSNVINGSKTVGSEIARRVEQAMKELGYQPDAKAQRLRRNENHLVGVILPNTYNTIYAHIYAGIEAAVTEAGYPVNLYTTNDSVAAEKSALSKLQQDRADCIILLSCMPENTERFDSVLDGGTKLIFIRRKPRDMYMRHFIGLDEGEAIYEAVLSALRTGIRHPVLLTENQLFSNESDAAAGFRRAVEEAGLTFSEDMIRTANSGKEGAFRACVSWMQAARPPEVIFTTNEQYALGARTCVEMFCQQEKKPCVTCLTIDAWVRGEIPSVRSLTIPLPFAVLGRKAGEEAARIVSGREVRPSSTEILPYVGPAERFRPSVLPLKQHPLRIHLLEGAAAYAAKLMASRFTKVTGIETEVTVDNYARMYAFSESLSLAKDCDVIQVNAPWLPVLSQKHALLDLTDRLQPEQLNFDDDILQRYAVSGGRLYAIPYMLDVQLLFYRKDLFDHIKYQRLYYESCREELRPPKNWEEYDRIAKFFTRAFNPDSPVKYGTTLGGQNYYSTYGFMPRLWEMGGDVYNKEGRFIFNSRASAVALRMYADSFRYADPRAVDWDWQKQTLAFTNGEAAMMPLYQAHFMDHLNQENVEVDRRIGVSPLPGGQTVFGGWSLAINAGSDRQAEAAEFLRWLCSPENAIPYNVLGGSLPGKTAQESLELKQAYPWFDCACRQIGGSRFMISRQASITQSQFEFAAGGYINRCIRGELTPEETVEEISRRCLENK